MPSTKMKMRSLGTVAAAAGLTAACGSAAFLAAPAPSAPRARALAVSWAEAPPVTVAAATPTISSEGVLLAVGAAAGVAAFATGAISVVANKRGQKTAKKKVALTAFEAVQAALGYFDPLGLSQGDVETSRESEVKNGRVAMYAALGFTAPEYFKSLLAETAKPSSYGHSVLGITGSDKLEKSQHSLSSKLANGRLAMMATTGMLVRNGLLDTTGPQPWLPGAFKRDLGAQECSCDDDSSTDKVARREALRWLPVLAACAGAAPSFGETGVTKAWGNRPDGSEDTIHTGGVEWEDIKVGTGASPKIGNIVAIQFVCKCSVREKEIVIDDTAGKPRDYRFGVGQMLPGMDEGIQGMRTGGVRKLKIPGNLAFGTKAIPAAVGRPQVPPMTPVEVTVTLDFIPGADGDVYGEADA